MRIFVNQKTAADSNYHSIEIDAAIVFDAGMPINDVATWVGDNYARLLNYFSDTRTSTKWAVHIPDVASVVVNLTRSTTAPATIASVSVLSCYAYSDELRHGKKARNQDVYIGVLPKDIGDVERIVRDAVVKGMKRDVLCCKAMRHAAANIDTILHALMAGRVAYDEVETLEPEPVEVEHGDVVDVELAETSETIPVVEAGTRSVESAPQLPAECEAVTQEIPEVPPQTNGDAHVLAVSEAVIPGGMSVGQMFPSVPYRAVRAFKRVVAHADGTVSRKKVAYAFRVGDVVQVLRRDRYVEAGADKVVESEIAAYVAKLRQAA